MSKDKPKALTLSFIQRAMDPFNFIGLVDYSYPKVTVGLEGAKSIDTVAPRTEDNCGTSKLSVVGGG